MYYSLNGEHEIVLYRQWFVCTIHLMEKIKLSFIDSDLYVLFIKWENMKLSFIGSDLYVLFIKWRTWNCPL